MKNTALEQVIGDFQAADDEMRLEMLLEYADLLPVLPVVYRPLRDAGMNMVHECQSPVFLFIEGAGNRVRIYGDVPVEAPTARSFVSFLIRAFDGMPAKAIAQAPQDMLQALGLTALLGLQRRRGLTAIYRRLQQEVVRQSG